MQEIFDLRVHINGKHTFFLDKRIVCKFSGRIRKMVSQERKRSSFLAIEDFPGGGHGFELVSRFCYSNCGKIVADTTPADLSILHCAAFVLEMTERASASNLLEQAEALLHERLPCWSWADVLISLECCNGFSAIADNSGLLERLVSVLVVRIRGDSDAMAASTSSCTSSSSSYSSSLLINDDVERWFNDLTVLSPYIIGKIVKALGEDFVSTRFLLHYLNAAGRRKGCYDSGGHRLEYGSLADALVDGVSSSTGTRALPFRWLLWVLRVVTGLGLSEERRDELERMIGEKLDEAALDDLLVAGHDRVGEAYDVSLVGRLVGIFVVKCEEEEEEEAAAARRMRGLGRLMDKYLVEISPDQGLKVSSFVGVARTLPDSARECFDGVYRALDIYLESHPTLSSEERTNLCQCLNYEKLTLEACRDLAKNPKIPPSVSFRALVAKHSELQIKTTIGAADDGLGSAGATPRGRVLVCATNTTNTKKANAEIFSSEISAGHGKEKWRSNLEGENWGAMECLEGSRGMKVPLLKKSSQSIKHVSRGVPRLC